MTIQFYMDVHIRRSITDGLRRIGLDVLTAQEDGCAELSDPDLLDRATQLGRVLFSMDDDLLTEATRRQNENVPFAGVIYAHQLRITVGQSVRDLSLIAEVYDVTDIANRVESAWSGCSLRRSHCSENYRATSASSGKISTSTSR